MGCCGQKGSFMAELTPIQSQVLAGLLAGGSIAAVAREHNIHRSTVYNWRHDHPAFNYALKDARRRHQTAMFDAGQDLAARAFETLGSLLTSEDEAMKLRAAQAILRAFAGMENAATAPEPVAIERAIDRNNRNGALAALPAGFELPGPADYPDVVQIDTIRQKSTTSTLKLAG